jgi:hypothetical protein
MNYEITKFHNEETNKMVGLKITNSDGKILYADKKVPLSNSKTNEQYVSEAISMCQDEIEEWENSFALIGKKWNSETNSFE